MSKPENDLQVTIRMPSSLKKDVDEFVEGTDITAMEFIRRAIKEKLERDETAPAEKELPHTCTKTEFKTLLLTAIQTDAEIQNELRAVMQKTAS